MTPRRRSPLPPGWYGRNGIRAQVLRRDAEQCQLRLPGCETKANEVHHTGAHDDHRLHLLVAACTRCHATVTAVEANTIRHAATRRPAQPHPGVRP